mmetsp:Transcript_5873/g.23778  ORF Transcript_5873/g.23778 Transcript_5873/m.23778 type:complete len:236 (+) Transcript_5873:2700-3407(+)
MRGGHLPLPREPFGVLERGRAVRLAHGHAVHLAHPPHRVHQRLALQRLERFLRPAAAALARALPQQSPEQRVRLPRPGRDAQASARPHDTRGARPADLLRRRAPRRLREQRLEAPRVAVHLRALDAHRPQRVRQRRRVQLLRLSRGAVQDHAQRARRGQLRLEHRQRPRQVRALVRRERLQLAQSHAAQSVHRLFASGNAPRRRAMPPRVRPQHVHDVGRLEPVRALERAVAHRR